MKKRISLILALCMVMIFSLTGCVKVVQIGHEDEVTGKVKFDANANVEQMWESKVIPDLEKNAVDLNTLLTEANGNLRAVAKKYGHFSMGDKGELSYIVKGKAKVVEINKEKKAGFANIEVEGYSGPIKAAFQVGPVYKASAVRDCVSFIKYEDYTNQVDWAAISQSLHKVVQSDVIDKADLAPGKTYEFVGCFTVDKPDLILITPIKLEAK